MNRRLRSETGMTLVEMLVAGVISTVVAGTILMVWKSYDDRMREGSRGGMLQAQYAAVSNQIAKYTREAHRVLGTNQTQISDNCMSAGDAVAELYFYDYAGAHPNAAIKIQNGILYEFTDSSGNLNGKPFTVGADTVHADTASFTLSACRNSVTVNLAIKRPGGDSSDAYTPGPEVFTCRN